MQPSHSNRFLNGIFAIIAVTIATVFLVSIRQSKKIKDAAAWGTHTQEVRKQVQRVVIEAVGMQSWTRGYLITGKQYYLDQANLSIDTVLFVNNSLRRMVLDNPAQVALTDSLKANIFKRIEITKILINHKKNGNETAIAGIVSSGIGDYYINRVRAIAAEMEEAEMKLLALRKSENDESLLFNEVILYCVLLGVVLLSFLLFHRMKKGMIAQHASERKFRAMLDAAPDAMVITDGAGIIKMINRQTSRLFGYASFELINQPVEILIPASLRHKHVGMRQGYVAHPATRPMGEGLELEAVKKNGEKFPVEISLSPIETDEGLMVSASVRDITLRKKAQEQLHLLKLQIEGSSDAIVTVDRNRCITNWNKGAERLFGYSKEEVMGKVSTDVLRMDLSESDRENIERQVVENGYWTGEVKRYSKNNTPVYVISSITAIRDNMGEITGFISVNYDLSTQQKLREQINHLAKIVEHSSEAILSRDHDLRLMSWNTGAEKLFGYTREEAIGKSAMELGIIRFTPEEYREMDEQLNSMGEWHAQKTYYHKNGNSFFGEVNANVITNHSGEPQSVLYVIRDITSHIKLGEFLKNANEELERKVKIRTDEIYRAESRYRSTLETMMEGVQIIDHDLRYIYVNEAVAKQASMTREELTGKLVTELFPGVEQTPLYKSIKRCMATNKPQQLESEFQFPSGEIKFFQLSLQPIPEGIFILSVDITGRKNAEDELKKSLQQNQMITEKLSAILNTLPANIALLDENGIVVDVNDAWKHFAVSNGLDDPNHAVGVNYLDVCIGSVGESEEDGIRVAKGIKAVLGRSLSLFEYEYACHSPEEERWFRMLVAPLHHEYYNGAVVMHVSITELKKMEAERMRMQIQEQKNITRAMLEGQEKERTQIGRELHDNITQIMAAIKMKLGFFISTYRQDASVLQQIMHHTQTAITETRSLSHQMVMPKFGNGMFESEIKNLLTDYITTSRQVHCNFKNFDEETVPLPVKEALYRIIQEQLQNIEKYARAANITIEITGSKNTIVMKVSDDGEGFDPLQKKKGIGLTNIQNRAESYGGSAVVDAAPGKGCRLIVMMPAR